MSEFDKIINTQMPTPSVNSYAGTKLKTGSQSKAQQLKQACQDFESIFVNQMFQQMRKTISTDGLFDGGRAEEMFTSMQDAELAKSMSRNRGLGLAEVMYRQLAATFKIDDKNSEVK